MSTSETPVIGAIVQLTGGGQGKADEDIPMRPLRLTGSTAMAVELQALRAELATLRAQLQEASGQIEYLDMQNNTLRNQIADVQKNAERYRFLRGDGGPASVRWPRWRIEHWSGVWNPVQTDAMDAAIDNAMKGEGRE